MSTRPRLLVLAPRYPYPVVGGDRLRLHGVCRELAKQCSLTLVSLCTREESQAPPPDDGVFDRIERIVHPTWRGITQAAGALCGQGPLQVAYYRNAAFQKRVNELLPEHDIALAHLIRTAEYLRTAAIPKVLEMTDAISLGYQRVRSVHGFNGFRSAIYSLESRRLLTYERDLIDHFDTTVLVSDVDRRFLLGERQDPRVLVCSNGVDLQRLSPRDAASERDPVVVFIGNMTTLQNLDACRDFIAHVLPRLRDLGDFRFRIIGRIRPRDAAALRRHPHVEVTGSVTDIGEAVGRAFAGVAPMRLAAGVQNKVLEYLALGLPAVISPEALEGLAARPDHEVMVAHTPQAWIQHLGALWRSPARAQQLAQAGRHYVQSHHQWPATLAPLLHAVNQLLSRATTG